jgi:AcrR family transcriptional regulator
MTRLDEIRTAALELFCERGYTATSMKDIAARLNIQAPSLYNHVSSKQELLQLIMFEGIERIQRDFDDAIATTDDVAEQIRYATEAHVRHHARRALSAHVNTYEISSLEEPARTDLIDRRREYARRWIELIELGNATGVCRARFPQLAAYAIIDMGIGVARWFREDGELSELTIAAIYAQIALRIVGASQSGAALAEPELAADQRRRY